MGKGEGGGGGGDRQEGKGWAPQVRMLELESGRDRVEEEEELGDLQEALLK